MKKIFNLFLFSLIIQMAFAKLPAKENADLGFMENKGQILDQNRNPNPRVLFLLNGKGLNVQIRKTGFSYDSYTTEKKNKTKAGESNAFSSDSIDYIRHFHRVDIEFLHSNANPEIEALHPSKDFTNYYNIPNSTEGILNVYRYQKVLVKNVYPGIDLEYLIEPELGFKYNFIVHPGADYKWIQLQYSGADAQLQSKQIELNTVSGLLTEEIPLSWIVEENNKAVDIEYKQLEKDVFGFHSASKIDKSKTLIIDPTLARQWATYFGGTADEMFRPSLARALNVSTPDIYLACLTNSLSNIASGAGVHQSINGGGSDLLLACFDNNGVRLWSTYYGGNGADNAPSVAADLLGNIYLGGLTASSDRIALSGSHQAAHGGGVLDAFLVKFNGSGVRQWSTYYGGSGAENDAVSVATDPSNNVYLVGITNSTNNIASPLSLQTGLAGGYDNFIAKFNASGVRQWATYYGGTGEENYMVSVSVDGNSNVYMGGTTGSNSNISYGAAMQPTYGGGICDAYFIKFSSGGTRIFASYCGGLSTDYGTSLVTDASANFYFTGWTTSNNNLSTSGGYQLTNGGAEDIFLEKFNSSGVRLWGTFYGGAGSETNPQITSDGGFLNVHLAGLTTTSSGLSTAITHQANLAGGTDAFYAYFNSAGARQWASYYGGILNESSGVSIVVDPSSNSFLAGITNSTGNISTPGSHQSTIGGNNDAFLLKLYACTSPLGSIGTISMSAGQVCAGVSKTFTLSGSVTNAVTYTWTLPAGWTLVSGQGTLSIVAIPYSSGSVTVKAFNVCNEYTVNASLSVNLSATQPSAITGNTAICKGVAYTYSVTNVSGATYQWTLPSGFSGTSTTNSISVTPNVLAAVTDTIKVRAIISGCTSSASTLVVSCSLIPLAPSPIQGNNPACKNQASNFSVDSLLNASTYVWTFPSAWTINSGSATRVVNVTPGTTAVAGNITVKGNNYCGLGPATTLSASTPVTAPAQPSTISGSVSICSGSTQTYSVSNAGFYYRWVLPIGWTLNSGQGTNSISVSPGSAGGTLTVYAANGGNNACESPARTLAVSVITTPVNPDTILGPNEVCINSSYNFSTPAIPNATTYTWTLPGGFTIGTGANTNAISVNTAASLNASLILLVKANNGICSSNNDTFNISGYSSVPAQPGTITGSTSLCANSNQSYSIATVSGATSYTWTLPVGWTFNGVSNTTLVNVVAGSATGTVSVIAKNGACNSPAKTLSIATVNPAPNTPGTISNAGSICSGKQTTFSIAAVGGATSYIWTLPSGWTGSSTGVSINITPNSTSDTLRVAASNGSCNSLFKKQFIVVNQTPVQPASITGNNLVCINTIFPFHIARQTPATSYTWTAPSGWTITSGGNDTFITATPNGAGVSGDITVVANNFGCTSIPRTNPVSVNTNLPTIPGAINGSNIVCENVTNSFSISSVPNALTYTWTVPTGWTINSGQNSLSIQVTPNSNTGQVLVKAVNGACKSSDRGISISNVIPPPDTPAITGDKYACLNTPTIFSINQVPSAISYLWTSPSGWTISNPNTTNTSILIAEKTGVIQVKANNGYCFGPPASINIKATEIPVIQSLNGETSVKSFAVRTYNASKIVSVMYYWTFPSDWSIISGANQGSVTVLTGASSGLITVVASNKCGTGPAKSISVKSGISAGFLESELMSEWNVYPVPANQKLTVSFTALVFLENASIVISDLNGKQLLTKKLEVLSPNTRNEIQIESSELANGIYLLTLQSENFSQTSKIIINH